MHKCKKKDCYWKIGVDHGGSCSVCGYCYYTGEPRGCPADKCDRYTSKADAKAAGLAKRVEVEGA